jgi:hypothetical protein
VPRLVYPPLCPFGTADVVLNEHEACCRMRAVDQGESLSYESRHWTKLICAPSFYLYETRM